MINPNNDNANHNKAMKLAKKGEDFLNEIKRLWITEYVEGRDKYLEEAQKTYRLNY